MTTAKQQRRRARKGKRRQRLQERARQVQEEITELEKEVDSSKERTDRLRLHVATLERMMEGGPLRLSEMKPEDLPDVISVTYAEAIRWAEASGEFIAEEVYTFSPGTHSLVAAREEIQARSDTWVIRARTVGAADDEESLHAHVVIVGRTIVRSKHRRRSHRLIDRLGRLDAWRFLHERATEEGAGILVIDNCAEAWTAMHGKGEHFDVAAHAPVVQPPFSQTWVEYGIKDSGGHHGAFGMIMVASRPTPGEIESFLEDHPGDDAIRRAILPFAGQGAYLVFASGVFETDQGDVAPAGTWIYSTDEDGAIAHGPEFVPSQALAATFPPGAPSVLDRTTQQLLYPCLFAISLMHCKNVSAQVTAPSHKLSRAYRKRHGKPLVTYRTIVIDSMTGERAPSEPGDPRRPGEEPSTALHICRGHFKTYTAEAPLLGRHVGTYWWPQHARGARSQGEVVKDYEVKEASG